MKKNKLKALQESLGEAIAPILPQDRKNTVSSLLEGYRSDDIPKSVNDTPTSTRTSPPNITPTSTPTSSQPIAPLNNFQKVTNTITKEAIPQRLFRTGKTKEIYDVLYSLTRGAIVPSRSIVISKPNLRKLTGVGSRVTLDTCLGYLEIVNLIRITKNFTGQHEGNEYEVFTPEEIGITTPTSTGSSTPPSPAQIEGVVPRLDNRRTSTGSNSINIEAINDSKTSFKDNKINDDEPFGAMNDVLKRIGKGKSENWKELAELLEMEFQIAAARTKSVTNAPAFLTEHLRRRLIGKSETPKPKANKLSQVGKQQPAEQTEVYKAEPLSEEGRESTLKTFLGYIEKGQKDFLMSLQDTYTKEDWDWLTSKIEEGKQ
jgi:hypothetical protein